MSQRRPRARARDLDRLQVRNAYEVAEVFAEELMACDFSRGISFEIARHLPAWLMVAALNERKLEHR